MKAITLLEYGGQLVLRCPEPDARARRNPGEGSKAPPSIHLDLVKASGTLRTDSSDRPAVDTRSTSFPGSSKKLAVTWRHGRQVMPCSEPAEWARTRSSVSQAGDHRKEATNVSFEEAHQCQYLPNCLAGNLHARSAGEGTNDPDTASGAMRVPHSIGAGLEGHHQKLPAVHGTGPSRAGSPGRTNTARSLRGLDAERRIAAGGPGPPPRWTRERKGRRDGVLGSSRVWYLSPQCPDGNLLSDN